MLQNYSMLLFHLLFSTSQIDFEKLNFVISQLINYYCSHHLEFNKLFSCLSTFNCKLSSFKSTKDSVDNSHFSLFKVPLIFITFR